MALVSVARQCRWPQVVKWIGRNLASGSEKRPEPLNLLLASAGAMPLGWQNSLLDGLGEGFRGWRKAAMPPAWEAFTGCDAAKQRPELIRELSSLFGDGRALEEIRRIVHDDRAELAIRQQALASLIDARPGDLRSVCESLLNVRTLNATAARGLALFDDPRVGPLLVRSYRRFHPDDRPALLGLLVSRPSYAAALLEDVGAGSRQIPRSEITAFHARQIRGLGDESLNQTLARVWGELRDSPADRRELIVQLRQQLESASIAAADLPSGRALFDKTCAQCHMLFGNGKKVGPDLTGSQRTNLDYLLENIVDPSAVVGANFRMSLVATTDGRVLNGLVVSRNDKTMVLQTQTEQQTLNVADVAEVRETNLSSMPDGLLKDLSSEQIRDLIAYLMHPSQVPPPPAR
jgi:putative heme-binding domain-containing protein